MGVYTREELEYELPEEVERPKEIDVTPRVVADSPATPEESADPDAFPQVEFEKYFPQWRQLIENGKSPDRVIAVITSGGRPLTDAQLMRLREVKVPIDGVAKTVARNEHVPSAAGISSSQAQVEAGTETASTSQREQSKGAADANEQMHFELEG